MSTLPFFCPSIQGLLSNDEGRLVAKMTLWTTESWQKLAQRTATIVNPLRKPCTYLIGVAILDAVIGRRPVVAEKRGNRWEIRNSWHGVARGVAVPTCFRCGLCCGSIRVSGNDKCRQPDRRRRAPRRRSWGKFQGCPRRLQQKAGFISPGVHFGHDCLDLESCCPGI